MTRARPWVALIAAAIVFALVRRAAIVLRAAPDRPIAGGCLTAGLCCRQDCCANLSGANLLPHLPSLSQLAPILAVATWSGPPTNNGIDGLEFCARRVGPPVGR